MEQDEAEFNKKTARLIRREALRRAAEELNPMTGPGLEGVLGRISAEVTAEALEKQTREISPEPSSAPRQSHPSKP
jgi:hypothetical protein